MFANRRVEEFRLRLNQRIELRFRRISDGAGLIGFEASTSDFSVERSARHEGDDSMMTGDLCPFCLQPGCAGDWKCNRRLSAEIADVTPLLAAQTMAEVRASERVLTAKDVFGPIPPGSHFTDDTPVVFSATPPVAICKFCKGDGGLRVPCHGCGVIGPTKGESA